MFGSTVLEVAIGLVFVYLMLSLICSAINEFIGRLRELRFKTLRAGLEAMLGKEGCTNLLDCPLIQALTGEKMTILGFDHRPTYIPARTFALALLDTVAPAEDSTVRNFVSIRQKIASLADDKLKRKLLSLLDSAEGDLNKARANIERWFDETMDEVSAWYRGWANTWLFFVALLVCAVLNADSIAIGTTLWRDPTLRAAVTAAAEKAAQHPPKEAKKDDKNDDKKVDKKDDKSTPLTRVKEIDNELKDLQIPMGWTTASLESLIDGTRWTGTLQKVFGILFTAFAASLGAPFWFDLLNKLVNFRSAGNKPAKSVSESAPSPAQQLEISVKPEKP